MRKWSKYALLNLCIVAAFGTLLRYKIAFPLEFVQYKNLLQAHSHFAFYNWVSLALFSAITEMLFAHRIHSVKKYRLIFLLMQVSGFGMLLSFPFEGYGPVSISFSTLSIFVSYYMTAALWKDLNLIAIPTYVSNWFRAALLFNVVSSIGPFFLAWLMMTHSHNQQLYIGSVYFFLHFQYNGWFLFSILGLLFYKLYQFRFYWPRQTNIMFWLMAAAGLPAYFLSTLWMRVPGWIYLLTGAVTLIHISVLLLLWKLLRRAWPAIRNALSPTGRMLLSLSFLAFNIKILLQSCSSIPALSKYAFGYRPIVIGYLHLVLLGFVSLFLLGYQVEKKLLVKPGPAAKPGLFIFVSGVILNELLLMIQGIASLSYRGLPVVNYLLVGASAIMLTGLLLFFSAQNAVEKTLYPEKKLAG